MLFFRVVQSFELLFKVENGNVVCGLFWELGEGLEYGATVRLLY